MPSPTKPLLYAGAPGLLVLTLGTGWALADRVIYRLKHRRHT